MNTSKEQSNQYHLNQSHHGWLLLGKETHQQKKVQSPPPNCLLHKH